MDWFGVVTQVAAESRVALGLQQRNIRCHLPVMTVFPRIRGRTVEKTTPLLSRYLFIHASLEQLSEVHAVTGVVGILPCGREPQPIPSDEVEELQARELCLAA